MRSKPGEGYRFVASLSSFRNNKIGSSSTEDRLADLDFQLFRILAVLYNSTPSRSRGTGFGLGGRAARPVRKSPQSRVAGSIGAVERADWRPLRCSAGFPARNMRTGRSAAPQTSTSSFANANASNFTPMKSNFTSTALSSVLGRSSTVPFPNFAWNTVVPE